MERFDIILMSASLQYISYYEELIVRIRKARPDYVILDRLLVSNRKRFCMETVPKTLYESSYPVVIFNKNEVDCYTRTRQILMNGIEVEAWNFKHNFARITDDEETKKFLAMTKRVEDMQQTTINWLAPSDQSILETTLGYEQVAVDLTAWLAQNEPDEYVKETFNFGLLEDFDHLYRYSQWAYMQHGICPNDILQGQTDVVIGRPTQNHPQ